MLIHVTPGGCESETLARSALLSPQGRKALWFEVYTRNKLLAMPRYTITPKNILRVCNNSERVAHQLVMSE